MKLVKKPVVMSNSLVRAVQTMTLPEKRLVAAAIAKMRGFSEPVTITATEYADTFDVSIRSNAYADLQKAAKLLQTRVVLLVLPDDEHCEWFFNWTVAVGYNKKRGSVKIEFSPKLIPHLVELQRNFTQYKLEQAARLRSVYSWRLLELLEQMRQGGRHKTDKGWLEISIDEFALAMGAYSSTSSNFAQLRRKIIIPAVKELQEKDGWQIEFTPIKTGRKVTALRFDFKRNPQGRLPL